MTLPVNQYHWRLEETFWGIVISVMVFLIEGEFVETCELKMNGWERWL